jgi:hypothetical protein
MHNVTFVCWLLAFICFVLSAAGVSSRVNLIGAGLAFAALAHLIV